ncbi:MAG: hypothetical protein VKP62_13695 [Candidatus Sericytochromatia bacterium]|nr:hypothetical protein [Candidatus Sericytochromatia bacterium]
MSEFLTKPVSPVSHDEDEESISLRAPVVAAKAGEDRLNPPMEYEVLDLAGEKSEALKQRLNQLGQEGWVLVAAAPLYVFRRARKPEDAKPKGRVGFGL